jgi:hypothetical protein
MVTTTVGNTDGVSSDATTERYARWSVILMLGLTLAANIPLLIVDSAYDDDWAWVWVNYWQGAQAVQDYMWMIAHPGFGPILNFFFWLGGDIPGRFAHAVAVACHLGSGWLLWRIFREGQNTAALAATIAIGYLASPFLAGIRGSFAHNTYDVLIVCYLLSIWLSGRNGVLALGGAIICCVFALSLETLMALEAIRWWYLYQRGYRGKVFIRRVAPYFLLVIATIVLRMTWLVPTGYTTGHNAIEPFSIIELLRQTRAHLAFFLKSLEPLKFVPPVITSESIIVPATLTAFSALIGICAYRSRIWPQRNQLLFVAIIGLMVLGAGALPYIAAHRPPWWFSFYSRLAVASQFGVIILGAVVLEVLGRAWLRGAILAVAVFAFSALGFQIGKWALYDEEVMQDFQSQLATEFRDRPPELLYVHFRPRSDLVMYIGRCLANYDINVAMDLKKERNGSYAYDADCEADQYTADNQCGVTGFDMSTCPPAWRAEYVLKPGMDRFTNFRFIDLAANLLRHRPFAAGDLVVNRSLGPGVAGSMKLELE